MNSIFISLVLVHLFVFSAGEKCQMLDGSWFDEYGSQMRLHHDEDGTLSGSYRADKGELGANSSSNTLSDVSGAAVYNQSGAVFSLSLMWMDGASIKAWIETTTTSPRHSCSLIGRWYNQLGSEMYITVYQNTTIRGKYWTGVELSNGAAGANYSVVYGMGNDLDANTAIALYVVWNHGMSVTGWVGQCHLRGWNQTETLETTWLLRSKVDSCDDNWQATRVGQDYFTRERQTTGPRKQLGTDT